MRKYRVIYALFIKPFFRDSFNLWYPLLIVVLYYQTNTQSSFWYKWINPRSFIQRQKTLLVELIRIYY